MQNVLKQAYQADVLLRQVHMVTVSNNYEYNRKNEHNVVITTENTYQNDKVDWSTYTHRIDVVIPCETKTEAIKLNKALKEYLLTNEMMLPLHVGVFQKPFSYKKLKSRKHYAVTIDDGSTILKLLPELSKDKSNKFVVGATPIESNVIVNGFDLTYQIRDYRMEHLFMDKDFDDKPLENPIYRLSLYTSSIFESEDTKSKEKDILQSEELLMFHIKGDSESEIIALATKLQNQLKDKKHIFMCKGGFPKPEEDFYAVTLGKNANELLQQFSVDTKKAS